MYLRLNELLVPEGGQVGLNEIQLLFERVELIVQILFIRLENVVNVILESGCDLGLLFKLFGELIRFLNAFSERA